MLQSSMDHFLNNGISIDEVRKVLKDTDGWFEPRMESGDYILDRYLENYPYIVVRVITGISKDGDSYNDMKPFRVFAVNLKRKGGWIRTWNVAKKTGWEYRLIEHCRQVYRHAVQRAHRSNCKRMTIEAWQKQHGNYPEPTYHMN